MEFATFDPLTASDDELITWCETASFIYGGECFEGLVRPASNVVIKIGSGVTEQEARNQTFAYEQLKDTNLQVPQVYRFFSMRDGLYPEGIPYDGVHSWQNYGGMYERSWRRDEVI